MCAITYDFTTGTAVPAMALLSEKASGRGEVRYFVYKKLLPAASLSRKCGEEPKMCQYRSSEGK